jgi:hypothetical protein
MRVTCGDMAEGMIWYVEKQIERDGWTGAKAKIMVSIPICAYLHLFTFLSRYVQIPPHVFPARLTGISRIPAYPARPTRTPYRYSASATSRSLTPQSQSAIVSWNHLEGLSVSPFGTNYPGTLSPLASLPPSLVSLLFLPKLSSSRRYTKAGGMILPTHPPSSSLQVLRTSMLRWWRGNRNVGLRISLLKRFTCFSTHCAVLLEWRVEGEMSRLNRRCNGEGTDRDIWRTQWDLDRKWRRGCCMEKDRNVDGSVICWA